MYEAFYKFSAKPFNTTPDVKFFFPSEKHNEALNSLVYAVTEKKGFIVLTGEIGAGKTTVCRALINQADRDTKIAVITNTHLTCRELLEAILEEFEAPYQPGTKQKLLSQLNAFLLEQLRDNVNVVLIIDEAQNLTPKVLEEVRMLSNLETETEKLIQIILIGQPQLKAKLSRKELEQFKQRIAVYYHIAALNRTETKEYIKHRLSLACLNGSDIFSNEALEKIYHYSGGIPRLINLICDSALLSGYAGNIKVINAAIIEDAVKERSFEAFPEGEIK